MIPNIRKNYSLTLVLPCVEGEAFGVVFVGKVMILK